MLPTKIREYLAALEKSLRHSKHRDSTLEEITAHFTDAIERYREEGLADDEAATRALANFGDARALGAALRSARRPWYLRWTVLLPSSFALASVLAVTVLTYLTQGYLEEAENVIRGENPSLELFLRDQETLKAYPMLAAAGRAHDAGPFLNPRVKWEGKLVAARFEHPTIMIHENEAAPLERKDWLTKTAPRGLDFTWMSQLSGFDHWDLWASDGPGRDNLEKGFNWYQTSIPDYSKLKALARARYLKGFEDRDALRALREVRQLILLVNSNELLISSMIAAAMFHDEAEFYGEAVRRKLMPASGFTPLPENVRLAYKRAAYSAGEWVDLMTPPEILARLSGRELIGLCGALAEAQNRDNITRMYFHERVWPEADLSPNFTRMNAFVAENSNRCRLTYSRTAPAEAKWIEYDDGAHGLSSLYHRYAVYVPVLRRYEGAWLYSIAHPNWNGQYHRLLEAREPASK